MKRDGAVAAGKTVQCAIGQREMRDLVEEAGKQRVFGQVEWSNRRHRRVSSPRWRRKRRSRP